MHSFATFELLNKKNIFFSNSQNLKTSRAHIRATIKKDTSIETPYFDCHLKPLDLKIRKKNEREFI